MLICQPKQAQPCFFYRSSTDQLALNTFLVHCGGSQATFEPTGKALFATDRKGQSVSIFVMPGSWVRCLDKGQFTAVPDRIFQQQFELVC
ncbi:hypothetical protein M0L20_02700 [Spirosoma sp. RP8]|uniref:Uncharacterized protein n=1 Tax=Spirosoma liriopis TaxID=2937440 RepID=A0ABT0HF07_9BACT|nr:hypothetical protein [Spirosoma liriopis]MCK8490743.1 hypothetical protein [Spirosoma liriopis]